MEQNIIHGKSLKKGFTLIELSIVIAIIGILYMIAIPKADLSIKKAKESALKANLYILRDAIDKYYADFKKYPETLEELDAEPGHKRYIRKIPVDPMTGKADWEIIYHPDRPNEIFDVKSRSRERSINGEPYNTW